MIENTTAMLVEKERQRQQKAILKEVRKGLKNNEFLLHYQPTINLRTRVLERVEALIRWQHPEYGLLLPEQFSTALNHTHLSIVIGEWVLKKSLADLSEWIGLGLPVKMSVNVSSFHLQQSNFVGYLESLLAKFNSIPPASLELEILEASSIENEAEMVKVLSRCRELGVSIALDDFGTGYSSVNYLKKLPLDTIKIDRSCIHSMLRSKSDRMTVAGVIGLNNAFGYQLIAEGVETKEHEKMLVRMGCTLGQGYSIARPMIAEKIPLWIISRSRYLQAESIVERRQQTH